VKREVPKSRWPCAKAASLDDKSKPGPFQRSSSERIVDTTKRNSRIVPSSPCPRTEAALAEKCFEADRV
jgi:hypothetical protein